MATGWSACTSVIHFSVLLCHMLLGQTGSDGIQSNPWCTVSHAVGGPEATCTGKIVTYIPSTLPPLLLKLKIINTSLAVLGTGTLSHLPRIEHLDLSGNQLTHLKPGCFRGILSLRYLNIAHNRLCFGDDAFPGGLFTGVTSLKTLVMHSNYCPNGHVGYPDKALGELKGLETLAMNGLPNAPFGQGFARMTSLKSLELSGKHCHLDVLSSRTFMNFENTSLSMLSVRACDVSSLDRRALTPLSSLVTLNLACNERIGWRNAATAVGAATTTRLDTFIMDNVSSKRVLLDKLMFESSTFRNVRRFSFRANHLCAVDVQALKQFPVIRNIALGYNKWTKILPSTSYMELLKTITSNMSLDVMDVSDFTSNSLEYKRLFCEPDHVDVDAFFWSKPILADVDYTRRAKPAGYTQGSVVGAPFFMLELHAANAHYNTVHFTLGNLTTNRYNDLVVLNISFTNMNEIIGPLYGFNNLQVFDASYCRVFKIHSGALSQLPNIKYVYLQHNVIGEKGDAIRDQFLGLHALLQLDLSSNRITIVDRDAFRDLGRLRYLNLRGNELIALSFDVIHMAASVSIDVSSNPVVSSKRGVAGECVLWEEEAEWQLTNVTLVCDCSNVTFIYWRQSAGISESLRCVNASRDDNDATCVDNDRPFVNVVAIAIAVAAIVVFVASAVAVAWRVNSRRRHSGSNIYSSVKSTAT